MKKNDLLEINIEDFTFDGFGVGHFNGLAVFTPNSAVGDRLLVRILKVKKNYAYAKTEKILMPSGNRIVSDCPHYNKCGGCAFRHISYNAELELKYKRVYDCMTRIGKIQNIIIDPIVKADNINFYRNKAQIPIRKGLNNKLVAGFYSLHSHKITSCEECFLHPQSFNQIVQIILQWISKYNIPIYDEYSNKGLIRHVYIRNAEKTEQIMVCLVVNRNNIPFESELIKSLISNFKNIKSIVINVNTQKTNVILGDKCKTLWGEDYISDELCGLKFNISPLSFYQVNGSQAEKLYNIARECAELSKNDVLIDMYCGTGTIGIYMSQYVNMVIGIEIVKQAIDNAIINAKNNNVNNIKFICDDAQVAIKNLNVKPTIIVLDPPRKGCSLSVINAIHNINPEKIIYISCEPSTLARDIKILSEYNYIPQKVIPVDLFPRTGHIECVVKLCRVEK